MVELLVNSGANIDSVTDRYDAITPIHLAIKGGDEELVNFLIEKGADVNGPKRDPSYAKDPIYLGPPLHTAVRYGRRRLVELLLKREADIEARNYRYMTALHVCAETG